MSNSQQIAGYETTIITKSELTDDALKNILGKVEKVVQSHGGEVVYTEDWGRRKLAYSIGKEGRGQYSYLAYTGKDGVVKELERTLRIQEPVLRFLTVKLSDNFNSDWYHKEVWYTAKRVPEREEKGRERGDREGRDYRDRDRDYE